MARSKHSTALFEVVSRSKPLTPGNRRGLFSSLSGWFTRHHAAPLQGNPTVAPAPAAAPPEAQPSLPITTSDTAQNTEPLLSRQIHLRISYTSLAILAVALFTLLAIAYIAGRKSGLSPRLAAASDNANPAEQLPAPGILDLRSPPQDIPPREAMGTPQPDPTQTRNNPNAPRTRSIGLNYVVIQTYPASREQKANEAAEFLRQNGIDCSVVKGLPRWTSKDSFSVVGYEGFARISNNPQLEAYKKRIREISDKFAKRGSFDAFEPKEYKWQ